MKKAMIIAAAMFAAFAVKASTVAWNYEGMLLDKDDGYDSDGLAWVVFLGDASDTSTIAVDQSGAIDAGGYAVRAEGVILYNQVYKDDTFDSLMTVENTSGNFALVGAYQDAAGNWFYGVTDPMSITVVANNDMDQVYGNLGTSDFSINTPVAVPEPTSVALLALGLAALGLKRKVA